MRSVFIDTSVWYAAADSADRSNGRAQEIIASASHRVTTDHVLAETWALLRWRIHREAAEAFWRGIRSGVAALEPVGAADLEVAFSIGRDFADQDFSFVDRTSFASMVRLGIEQVASFDVDFGVYRYGPRRERAFEVIR